MAVRWERRCEVKHTPTPMPSGYLRPAEAARYLSVSIRTLRSWTRAHVVPSIRPGAGRVLLFARGDLDRAMLRFREGGAA